MSRNKYEDLQNLKTGTYDYKIKVRVIRFWRGVTTEGEEFKGFNVILLDKKHTTIHAFVPALCAYDHLEKLKIGNVCIITDFTVQLYKKTDKFRCLRNNTQLIFCKDTIIQEIEDTGSNIEADWFDLYDHSDLKSLSQQNIHLADVVGVIKEHLPVANFTNRNGKKQSQSKFSITDGSSNIKVTFWDKFGDYFEKAMSEILDKPVIIIIASCRVGLWNEEVNLGNVAATKFYLNYPHHSVSQLRKMLTIPSFSQQVFASTKRKKAELLSVERVLNLRKEYIDTEVLIHVKIEHVDETNKWYYNACTSCQNETEMQDEKFICINCNRSVPYPDLKFKIYVKAYDETGSIQIILDDREVRTVIGKRALQMVDEDETEVIFPTELKSIATKDYTIKLFIKEVNVLNDLKVFWATNICNGFKLEEDDTLEVSQHITQSTTQESHSTYHLNAMSELHFQTPEVIQNKGKGVQIA